MAAFHRRASTGGFCCPLPEGIGSPGVGLFRTKPRWKIPGGSLRVDLRPFPPRGCLFGAAGVMRASMGDAGGFLRHSSGRSWVSSQPIDGLGWGVVDGAITLYDGSKRPGEEEVSRVELLPEPGSESRFRIPPEPGGSGLVGRDLLALRPSGWSTGFIS